MEKRELLKLLAAGGIGAAAAIATGGDSRSTGTTTYDPLVNTILTRGTLRAGYIVYPPFVTKDANTGLLSGLCYDVAYRLAESIGLKIEWVEETFFGTALTGLDTDRYEIIISNFWPNGLRARAADFTQPMFYSGLHILCRANDTRFDALKTYSELNSPAYSFALIDGEIAMTIQQARFPKARQFSMPQSTDYAQMMHSVAAGKADLALIEAAAANAFMHNNTGKLKNLTANKPFQVYMNSFPIKRNEPGLKALIDIAMAELHNTGIMNELLDEFEQHSNDLYRIAAPYSEKL